MAEFFVSVYLLAVIGAVLVVLSTLPYLLTGIRYRRRDNGLAYILFVLGVGVWNAMFAAQILSDQSLVKGYFLSLSVVGALLAGLGWFLFASTASSTPNIQNVEVLYGAVGLLSGVDVFLAVTSPVHALFWTLPVVTSSTPYLVVEPNIGYWFHTGLLALLFSLGTILFMSTWNEGERRRYTSVYAVGGVVTVGVIVLGNVGMPGGFSLAPMFAWILTTTGWLQAERGRVLEGIQSVFE